MSDTDRGQMIIRQMSEDTAAKYAETKKALEGYLAFLQQYKSVVDDLIEAKAKYADIVSRYSRETQQTYSVSTFPGVAAPTPTYSNAEMQMDSNELSELGDLISEMEDQRELIQSQMHNLLQTINGSSAAMTDTASQVLVFLSQAIDNESRDGLYGSPTLNTVEV